MRSFGEPNWPTYFVSGAAALILSWALSGCRFGNYEQDATTPNADTVTGYYESQPQTLTFCATQGSTELCKTTTTTHIPSLLSNSVTNPLEFVIENQSTGTAIIAATGATSGIGVTFASDLSISSLITSGSFQLWQDPLCTTSQALEIAGQMVQGKGPFNSGSLLPMTGRLTLKFSYNQIFGQNCLATLQAIANCYQDVTQCGGTNATNNQTLQTQWQNLFNPYIQSGAMLATDIPNVTTLGYEVSYQ